MKPTTTRELGRAGLPITVLGLGGAPIGVLAGPDAEAEGDRVVSAALAHGIGLFDTAPLYGTGRSEHRVGHALRMANRADFVISTKVARYLEPPKPGEREADRTQFTAVIDYSYEGAKRAFEQSLQRLGLNRVDILLIHDVDIWTHGTRGAFEQRFREAISGAYRALADLREQGVVRAIGIGVNEIEPCLRFAEAGEFDCFMLAGRYTLLEQGAQRELLPLLEKKRISLLIAGPFNSGILATGAVGGAIYDSKPATPASLDRVRRIEAVCGRYGVQVGACALQFPLGHPAVASVVFGAKSAVEVERNVSWFETEVPPELWHELVDTGLLAPDARLPILP
jgi:D-threo-aldose 1-dehydrogenase